MSFRAYWFSVISVFVVSAAVWGGVLAWLDVEPFPLMALPGVLSVFGYLVVLRWWLGATSETPVAGSDAPAAISPSAIDLNELQAQALAGDVSAAARFRIVKWNESASVGAEVFYEKSQIEGKCRVRTVSQAYLLGDDQPVVDVSGIGMVLLDKIELAWS